jgi:hypothetical protein
MAAPSINFLGNRANQAVESAYSRFYSTFDRFRSFVADHIRNNRNEPAHWGLRQEIPFERWFYDMGFQNPTTNSDDLIKAHLWAVPAVLEGLIKTVAETLMLYFATSAQEKSRHFEVLKAQWVGLSFSLLAVISPNLAKEKAANPGGNPLIGSSILDWRWGTLYNGKMEVPIWHIDCSQYPCFQS